MRFRSLLISLFCLFAFSQCVSAQVRVQSASVAGCKLKYIVLPLSQYKVKVGLAGDRVSSTEPLAGIAKRGKAVAAINGCFFNAYTSSPVKPPYHHIITNGKVVHVGNTGTTIGFDENGDYRMDRVKVSLWGELSGSGNYPARWYSYFINHPVENSTTAIIYDRTYCSKMTPAAGQQAVVSNGVVVSVGPGPKTIPADGFVVLFSGGESGQAAKLTTGKTCQFKPSFQCSEPDFWENVQEALACGPRLVADGEIAYEPASEGFQSPKILSARGARSAIGVTRDKKVILATCSGATVKQLAAAMKGIGAYDAMNLDGGASSCLWANGKYITSPGRNIGNALLIVKR